MHRDRAPRRRRLPRRLVAFDLSVAAEIFVARLRPRRPAAVRVRGLRRGAGSGRDDDRVRIAELAGPRGAASAPTPSSCPATASSSSRRPEAVLEALRAVVDRGGRVALDLHRGVRARPRGPARRPPGDHALVRRRRARPALPGVEVDADVLYVDEGDGPHLGRAERRHRPLPAPRRRDHGDAVGATVARAMVAVARTATAGRRSSSSGRCPRRRQPRATRRWALAHLAEPLDVATLADRAAVSPRTFARRFVAETRDDAAAVAACAAGARSPSACSSTPTCRSSRSRQCGIRLGALAARALPARDRDHADRLPATRSASREPGALAPLDRRRPGRSPRPIRFAAG